MPQVRLSRFGGDPPGAPSFKEAPSTYTARPPPNSHCPGLIQGNQIIWTSKRGRSVPLAQTRGRDAPRPLAWSLLGLRGCAPKYSSSSSSAHRRDRRGTRHPDQTPTTAARERLLAAEDPLHRLSVPEASAGARVVRGRGLWDAAAAGSRCTLTADDPPRVRRGFRLTCATE
jgi:hypothetical protein